MIFERVDKMKKTQIKAHQVWPGMIIEKIGNYGFCERGRVQDVEYVATLDNGSSSLKLCFADGLEPTPINSDTTIYIRKEV